MLYKKFVSYSFSNMKKLIFHKLLKKNAKFVELCVDIEGMDFFLNLNNYFFKQIR